MKKEQFVTFVEENILSMFTGSEIEGEEESSPRDTLVAQGNGGTLLVKFNKDDNFRIIIKRIQPFKMFEISLVKSIIEELKHIYSLNLSKEYFEKMQNLAIEKAVCKAVASNFSHTLFDLIGSVSAWAGRTYEGTHTSFGFLILPKKAPKNTNKNLHFSNVLQTDFSALVSDGEKTCLEMSSDGFIMSYLSIPKVADQSLYAPYTMLKMASVAVGNKVGVSLLKNGNILIFKDKSLLFVKKNGSWSSFSHEEIVHRLADRSNESVEEIRKAIYLSALDTSFARTGGCIVHLDKDATQVLKHIDKYDILLPEYYNQKVEEEGNQSFFVDATVQLSFTPYEEFLKEEKSVKIANLRAIIKNRKFYELDRKLRQELLSIDGATVINNAGEIVAVGAIIKIEAGSTGGGRLAATKTLSKYGVAIKISADGAIQGFRMDKQRLRTRPIFMIG